MVEIAVGKMKNCKLKRAAKLEIDMKKCLKIPLKHNDAIYNRAKLKLQKAIT